MVKKINIYSKLRTFLSVKNQGRLSKLLVNLGIKPTYNKGVVSIFEKGIVIFSADFEMAWAFRFSKTRHREVIEKGLTERKNLPVLLNLFDKYNIPVTWATVGHLFLSQCERGMNGVAHPDMPRPDFFENRNWLYNTGDWYKHDPCSNIESYPAWYASDLIDRILDSSTNHEIGCHTFSHLDFTYKNCTKELADAELDACIKLAWEKGIKMKSMVFPGGTEGNYESLKEKKFYCYRKPMRYHIDLPYIDEHGLVAIPSSLSLDRDQYSWTEEFHLKMIRKFLVKTARYKMVCHFWFHPSMDPWYIKNIMPSLLKMVVEMKQGGEIKILTMQEVAEIFLKGD